MSRLIRLALAATLCLAALGAAPASAATDRTGFTRWTSTAEFANGESVGITAHSGSVRLAPGTATGSWTSPWTSTGYDAKTLIPSWSIGAPGDSSARISVRVRSGSTTGSWDSVARWTTRSTSVERSSYASQTDDLAKLATDTVLANSGKSFTAWQVRVELMRPAGSTATPTLYSVGGTASTYLSRSVGTSKTTMTATKELAVPRHSQMIHAGEFPQWGGGGEAWCSPTSTAMVMRYFKAGPKPADYTWSKYADSFVDHAARYTYDSLYDGTGNWPFNTAYAADHALDAFVTRLANLRDAEAFIKAGIPLVASISYAKGKLTGAPITSTPGHLLVITGFAKDGRVIANDPAASKNSTVRRVYSRAQFEKAWLGGSGGVVYVIRAPGKALPPDTWRW